MLQTSISFYPERMGKILVPCKRFKSCWLFVHVQIYTHTHLYAFRCAHSGVLHFASLCRKPVRISDSVNDMHAFTRLHDGVLDQIMISQDPRLDEVRVSLSVFLLSPSFLLLPLFLSSPSFLVNLLSLSASSLTFSVPFSLSLFVGQEAIELSGKEATIQVHWTGPALRRGGI